jgi:DNA-binding LytR/AlgR family response regulator
MSTRAIIADDEPHLARYLADALRKAWPALEIVATLGNGTDAASTIDAIEPDVAFLDIQMPGLTGLEVAQGIEGKTLCVFVTAYDEFALRAFDEGAVDYLLKPVTDQRLAKCVQRLQQRLAAEPSHAPLIDHNHLGHVLHSLLKRDAPTIPAHYLRFVRAHERMGHREQILQIDVNDVLYFDAADKYTCVVLAQGEKLLRLSINELEAQLDPSLFQRIHRSTLVNLKFVYASRRDESGRMFVAMKDHQRELPVSRAYHEVFARM